jgi:hypothetical protein
MTRTKHNKPTTKNKTTMKTMIIALLLSVASLFAGAQTAQSATIVASELGPIIPPGWEIMSIQLVREGYQNPSNGLPVKARVRVFLLNAATGQTAVWMPTVDHF